MEHIIGIGEYKISNKTEDIIKTYALYSCIGIVAYEPVKKVMAMVHVALPNSKFALSGTTDKPARYADKAIDTLFRDLSLKYGCKKNDIRVSIHGGATAKDNDYFKVGEKNIKAVKKYLKDYGLTIVYEDVGGRFSRSLIGYVDTGFVEVIKNRM